MLKLKKDIFLTFLGTFVGSFFVLYLVAYVLLKRFFIENVDGALMDRFNALWLDIGSAFIIVFTISYFFIRRLQKRISQDTSKIQDYLEAIDAKNYDAVLKINYYTEYLHIAVLLKNLVKRLKNKDKKRD
ncbi:hypothetical protein [Sulfurimonas autotrophica]|uniref:Uncharacterized protein n=1 Tax=Sulfurimonas autotrophica (strain ATCC BAA-671 / DSM 16294 / JCM 11897 / OK10) TaxID=563040 RepID=E0UPQ6_SULAO|nr:hypothetical protein [Sulfurimonas autotrophica]ADN08648.1 hypothetical protein Saut_0599 [Sulfurimonas autotrophica DSM 16294]